MTGEPHILALLLQSAVRSALLGLCVIAALKLARLRDLKTETLVWTVVLAACLASPLLAFWSPGLTLRLPVHSHAATPSLAGSAHGDSRPWAPQAWRAAFAAYALIAGAGLVRLATGLVLGWRMCARAEPLIEPWAAGRDVRVSADVDSPLSLAGVILLPADYEAWPEAKLIAVIAHEDSHLRRGDFFIQALAGAHKALFWFSPFAWWLQRRLGELAEIASDAAALKRIADPAGYAEILVEVARQAHGRPQRAPAAALAMAGGPGVARRVEHILSGIQDRALGAAGRSAALALALIASLGFAEVRAAAAPDASTLPATPLARAASSRLPPGPKASTPRAASFAKAARANPSHARSSAAAPAAKAQAAPAEPQDTVTYDPRALLDGPSVIAAAGFLVGGPVGHESADGT